MSKAIVSAITAFRERPRLLLGLFIFALGAFVLYDVFAPRHGAHFVGDKIRGFWAMFGFFGAVLMTKIMKGLGYSILMKPTDYWDGEDGEG